MKSPLLYYGGKAKMVSKIVPIMVPHRIYVEPFFGGGAVFWEKGPSFQEVINDINHMVINFYEVLHSRSGELIDMVTKTIYSEHLHAKAYHMYQNPQWYNEIELAWAIWMVANFSFLNKIDGGWKFDTGSDGSHIGVTFTRKKVEILNDAFSKRLDNVLISCRDALDVCRIWNQPDTLLYLDPPYPRSDQGHYKGYTIDMLLELLDFLQNEFQGSFILSNYLLPEIKRYNKRNNWPIQKFNMRLSAKKGDHRKTEVLVTNYQPLNKMF